ncbi:MAG TPA: helix-turn-helix domain-containing protein [Polyangiaceae bacterium]|nr:helix-turn-helix domain-containing protein [Polyangiaceae bacterium]
MARIRATLDRHHWHVTDAAAALGVTRYALARAIKKHGLRDAH